MKLSYNKAYLITHILEVVIPTLGDKLLKEKAEYAAKVEHYKSLKGFKKLFAENPETAKEFLWGNPYMHGIYYYERRIKEVTKTLAYLSNPDLNDVVILDEDEASGLFLKHKQ